MKVLITAFDPFGDEKINPALELLERYQPTRDIEIYKLMVPTVFNKAPRIVIQKIDEIKPQIVILLGQAGGRDKISLERIAINWDNASIEDNEGNMPRGSRQDKKGPDGIFSSLDIDEINRSLRERKIPAIISNTAGTFVCNHLMYGTLLYIRENNLDIRAGFIHLPFLPEQTIDRLNTPHMTLDMMEDALDIIVNRQVELIEKGI